MILFVTVISVKMETYFLFQYISNKMQRYTVYFIWKLLYMFRVLPPPIIRSAYNCIYSVWFLSNRYCYLPLSWKSWNYQERIQLYLQRLVFVIPLLLPAAIVGELVLRNYSSNSSTIAAGSSNGVTKTRRCRYSCVRS